MFPLVTKLALKGMDYDQGIRQLVRRYRVLLRASAPYDFLDQCHPNLWNCEQLAESFPNAHFVGIQRNPFSVVYSMLNHAGVLRWVKRWEEFSVPNEFLGIESGYEEEYHRMTLVERCAMRWASHFVCMQKLCAQNPLRVHTIYYESLCAVPEHELPKVQAFLGYNTPFPVPIINKEALEKRNLLSFADRRLIRQTVIRYVDRLKSVPDDAAINLTRLLDW